MKKFLLLCIFNLVFNLFIQKGVADTPTPQIQKEIFVDVGRAGLRKHRMAILPFVSTDKNRGIAAAKRLTEILSFTGAFEFLDESLLPKKNDFSLTASQFEDWNLLKIESVVAGQLTISPSKKLIVEAKMFHVGKKSMLVGKRYNDIDSQDLELVLRRYADVIIETLTGELGIFSSKIAFIGAKKMGEPRQLYIANFDGTDLKQITNDKFITMSPAWSPDGNRIAYTSFRSGKAEIYVYHLITQKTVKLTHSILGTNSGANWHPDGRTLAFASSKEGITNIFSMDTLLGSVPKLLIGGSGLEVEPAYSPDGNKIAFASGRYGNPHIFIRDLAAKTAVRDVRITTAGWYNSTPAWRPDARKLVFAGYDKDIDRYDIFLANPNDGQLTRLTLDQGDNEKPTWSPDGRFILFQTNRAMRGRGKQFSHRLFVMNREGDNQRPLQIPLADVVMPAWGPRINELNN